MPTFALPSFLAEAASLIAPINPQHEAAARARLDSLAKPVGSLGRLEDWAAQLAGIQGGAMPLAVDPALMVTIAADHGVVAEGVAATPSSVTALQVVNFMHGGGAINNLCASAGMQLWVVDAGVDADLPQGPGLVHAKIARGTANFTRQCAMTEEQCHAALSLGLNLAAKASAQGVRLVGLGEMGIGNTTASTALFCAYLGFTPQEVTGIGAGIAPSQLPHKAAVIARALELHKDVVAGGNPVQVLAALGGLEIAALAGLIIGAASHGMAVMVDGFIATAAYVAALHIAPAVAPYCFFSHGSAEAGHGKVLARLGQKPLLDLGLRLGEGTGATLGVSMLRAAVQAYNGMVTLQDLGITLKG